MFTKIGPGYFFFSIIIVVYSLNLGGSAIWTTHEAYYAEAVREILETGSWSEFFFNYEPRFQKPPLTYWLMASSAWLFGLSEFTLRLPILLCSLLSVAIVYLLGKELFNQKVGVISMLVFSISLQFVWLRNYASPEIPLTLFFTLSIYWFLKGGKTNNNVWIIFSAISLGMAILTKGFPYFVLFVILWLIHKPSLFSSGKRIIPFFVISLLIGLSWPLAMAIKYEGSFTEVFFSETLGRALGPSKISFGEHLLSYPVSLLWGLLPFSLVFFYSFIKILRDPISRAELRLPLMWFTTFLVIFTISSGKLPVYLLQAYPAIALICGYMLVAWFDQVRSDNLFIICLGAPAVLVFFGMVLLIQELGLSPLLSWLLVLTMAGSIFLYRRISFKEWLLFSTWAFGVAAIVAISLGIMPWLEQFRPYREIKLIIEEHAPDRSIPLYIEGRFLDNMPYYAGRKIYGGPEWNYTRIAGQPGVKMMLLEHGSEQPVDGKVLWQGLIHAQGPEDHFFKFIRDCYQFSNGKKFKFINYKLVLINNP